MTREGMGLSATRARDELMAARVLLVSGLTTQAIDVALRAALKVAEAALLLIDRVPPATSAALVADFVGYMVRERGVDPDTGRAMRLLLNRHQLADLEPPPPAEAEAAIADAHAVVETVGEWIEVSQRVGQERRRVTPPR